MGERTLHSGRHAGVIVPLFSIPTRRSWGIGEIGDLPVLARWLDAAGLGFVQILPVNEMQPGQSSPYSALSAMAIDPIFISLDDVADFHEAGGWDAMPDGDRGLIDDARAAARVDYATVGQVKRRALEICFARFDAAPGDAARHAAFNQFVDDARWWIEEYALFRALHDEQGGRYWRDWPEPLRDRHADALAGARARLDRRIRFYQYAQWLADAQWTAAKAACLPARIVGDFPFMVAGHSADVWARQDEFRHDASIGTPPDAFSETGQDWGLPVCRWDVMARNGFQWFADRARRCAALYDAYRVDHLVGFYRTYVRERNGHDWFFPPDEPTQLRQGEALLSIFQASGPRIIAEDLGSVPDFVRASLDRMGVPGMKVLRWERSWKQEGQPFRDPAGWPAASVALSGTHDTETQAEWWDEAGAPEREALVRIPIVGDSGVTPSSPFNPVVRDALMRALYASGSDYLILVFADIFGWHDRINIPASIGAWNWTWRLPWPAEDLLVEGEAIERAAFLLALAEASGRTREG